MNYVKQAIRVDSLLNPEMEGYLVKMGGSIKTYKKRWFVLKGNTLYYFKSQKVRNFHFFIFT